MSAVWMHGLWGIVKLMDRGGSLTRSIKTGIDTNPDWKKRRCETDSDESGASEGPYDFHR